jgi:hypothetical protein
MILDDAKAVLDRQDAKGRAKYGGTLDETQPTAAELISHAIEEAADMLIYLCALRKLLTEAVALDMSGYTHDGHQVRDAWKHDVRRAIGPPDFGGNVEVPTIATTTTGSGNYNEGKVGMTQKLTQEMLRALSDDDLDGYHTDLTRQIARLQGLRAKVRDETARRYGRAETDGE